MQSFGYRYSFGCSLVFITFWIGACQAPVVDRAGDEAALARIIVEKVGRFISESVSSDVGNEVLVEIEADCYLGMAIKNELIKAEIGVHRESDSVVPINRFTVEVLAGIEIPIRDQGMILNLSPKLPAFLVRVDRYLGDDWRRGWMFGVESDEATLSPFFICISE